MRVAFCFIVMNGAAYLWRNLTSLNDFARRRFEVAHIFAVENDSVDATRSILQRALDAKLLRQCKHITLDGKHSTELCSSDSNPNCLARTQRLALVRNHALQLAYESAQTYDYLVMVDMDFVSVDFDALYDLFLYMQQHPTVDGIFGMSVVDADRSCPYDFGAIQTQTTGELDEICEFRRRYIRVKSAFSGFGVYRYSSLQRANVHYDPSADGIEHIAFNAKLSSLIVDSSFRPVYGGACIYRRRQHESRKGLAIAGTWIALCAVLLTVALAIVIWLAFPARG